MVFIWSSMSSAERSEAVCRGDPGWGNTRDHHRASRSEARGRSCDRLCRRVRPCSVGRDRPASARRATADQYWQRSRRSMMPSPRSTRPSAARGRRSSPFGPENWRQIVPERRPRGGVIEWCASGSVTPFRRQTAGPWDAPPPVHGRSAARGPLAGHRQPEGSSRPRDLVVLKPFARRRWAASETLERPATGQRARR